MTIAYNYEHRNEQLDEFITPPQLIRATVALIANRRYFLDGRVALDPGCNLGYWGSELRKVFPLSHIVGVELQNVSKNLAYNELHNNCDFLTYCSENDADLVIGNPPYSTRYGRRKTVVFDWVKHSMELLKSGGYLAFILREGFNHSIQAYTKVLNQYPIFEEWILLPRPNFYGEHDNRTDGSSGARYNYSLFILKKGWTGDCTSRPFYWKKYV